MKKLFRPMLAKDSTESEFLPDGTIDISSKYFLRQDEKNNGWMAENKYDGARYILQWDEEGKVYLTSRTISKKDDLPVDKTENLRGYLYDDHKDMAGIVLDGEVLVQTWNDATKQFEFPRDNGSSETNKIMLAKPDKCHDRLKDPNIRLVYAVYDCLVYNGEDITQREWTFRKHMAEEAAVKYDNTFGKQKGKDHIILVIPFAPTKENYEKAIAAGYEGIVLKNMKSPYVQGEHSAYWQKVKKLRTEDGVVMGATRGTGKYAHTMGALVIGQFFKLDAEDKKSEIAKGAIQGILDHPESQPGHILAVKAGDFKKTFTWDKDLNIYELREVCTISGMTDEQRDSFWGIFTTMLQDNPSEIISNDRGLFLTADAIADSFAVEFIAQEKTQSRYRHPRFVQIRQDKDINECCFE